MKFSLKNIIPNILKGQLTVISIKYAKLKIQFIPSSCFQLHIKKKENTRITIYFATIKKENSNVSTPTIPTLFDEIVSRLVPEVVNYRSINM